MKRTSDYFFCDHWLDRLMIIRYFKGGMVSNRSYLVFRFFYILKCKAFFFNFYSTKEILIIDGLNYIKFLLENLVVQNVFRICFKGKHV